MKLTRKYSTVSVPPEPEKKKQVSGGGTFTSIKRAMDQVAERIGSTVGIAQSRAGATFYLIQRPKTRQGRLNWNREVDRISANARERLTKYSPSIIVGRTGNQLELKRRRNG